MLSERATRAKATVEKNSRGEIFFLLALVFKAEREVREKKTAKRNAREIFRGPIAASERPSKTGRSALRRELQLDVSERAPENSLLAARFIEIRCKTSDLSLALKETGASS